MAENALATKRDAFMSRMEDAQSMIAPLLPRHVSLDKVLASMRKHLMENPKLLECSEASLFWAFVHAAEIGLTVGDFFGEGYVLGFHQRGSSQKRARFIPGYKGLLKLAYQSNMVARVDAYVIYEKDTFVADLGKERERVSYTPYLGLDMPGEVICVYTQVELKGGVVKDHIMPRWKLEKTRKASPGGQDPDHPWNKYPEEMFRKSGLRHALKDAPKSNEQDRALRLEEQAESGEEPEVMPVPGLDEAQAKAPSRTKDRVVEKAKVVASQVVSSPAVKAAQAVMAGPPSQPTVSEDGEVVDAPQEDLFG